MPRWSPLISFLIVSCSTLRREEAPANEQEKAADSGKSACAQPPEYHGVVGYDPHFHTIVHPPHSGTFVAPAVELGDTVTAATSLGEVVWGPHRGKILAPVTGVVVHAGAAIGSFLREGDAPFVIANPARLAVRFDELPAEVSRTRGFDLTVEGLAKPIPVDELRTEGAKRLVALPPGTRVRIGGAARLTVPCPA